MFGGIVYSPLSKGMKMAKATFIGLGIMRFPMIDLDCADF